MLNYNSGRLQAALVFIFCVTIAWFSIMYSCRKYEKVPRVEALIRLVESKSSFYQWYIKVVGQVNEIEDCGIYEVGYCWSKSAYPTVNDNKRVISNSNFSGSFVDTVSIKKGGKYYLRIYVKSREFGLVYSPQQLFSHSTFPVVKTYEALIVGANSAICNGAILDSGNAVITASGFMVSEFPIPANGNTKYKEFNTKSTSFSKELNLLKAGKLYYFRAFADNGFGRGVGEQLSFTTDFSVPIVNFYSVYNITQTEAFCEGLVVDSGGLDVSEYGICWSDLNYTPTIEDNHSVNSFQISGLTPFTKYYARVYAINRIGAGYSNVFAFVSAPSEIKSCSCNGYVLYLNYTDYINPIDSKLAWGGTFTDVSTTTYNGKLNTASIVAANGLYNDSKYAAKICSDLVVDGFDDWYLPSESEMLCLFDKKHILGGFGLGIGYWSSTQKQTGAFTYQYANSIGFPSGSISSSLKTWNYFVRCIRR